MSNPIRSVRIVEILESKDFNKMEIAEFAQYLDDRQDAMARKVIEKIEAKMVTKVQFWSVSSAIVFIILGSNPDSFEHLLGLLR